MIPRLLSSLFVFFVVVANIVLSSPLQASNVVEDDDDDSEAVADVQQAAEAVNQAIQATEAPVTLPGDPAKSGSAAATLEATRKAKQAYREAEGRSRVARDFLRQSEKFREWLRQRTDETKAEGERAQKLVDAAKPGTEEHRHHHRQLRRQQRAARTYEAGQKLIEERQAQAEQRQKQMEETTNTVKQSVNRGLKSLRDYGVQGITLENLEQLSEILIKPVVSASRTNAKPAATEDKPAPAVTQGAVASGDSKKQQSETSDKRDKLEAKPTKKEVMTGAGLVEAKNTASDGKISPDVTGKGLEKLAVKSAQENPEVRTVFIGVGGAADAPIAAKGAEDKTPNVEAHGKAKLAKRRSAGNPVLSEEEEGGGGSSRSRGGFGEPSDEQLKLRLASKLGMTGANQPSGTSVSSVKTDGRQLPAAGKKKKSAEGHLGKIANGPERDEQTSENGTLIRNDEMLELIREALVQRQRRGLASQEGSILASGLTGPNSNLWKKVRLRYQDLRSTLSAIEGE